MNEMRALKVSTPSEREITMTRLFKGPRDLVFLAYTKPELIRRWLLGPPGWAMPVCEVDARPGGRFRYVWRNEDGREMGMGGVFHEVTPPDRIVQSELFDEDWTGGEAVSTVVFTQEGEMTRMTHTVVYSSREARDGALASGMADGMEMGLARLDGLLQEGWA